MLSAFSYIHTMALLDHTLCLQWPDRSGFSPDSLSTMVITIVHSMHTLSFWQNYYSIPAFYRQAIRDQSYKIFPEIQEYPAFPLRGENLFTSGVFQYYVFIYLLTVQPLQSLFSHASPIIFQNGIILFFIRLWCVGKQLISDIFDGFFAQGISSSASLITTVSP